MVFRGDSATVGRYDSAADRQADAHIPPGVLAPLLRVNMANIRRKIEKNPGQPEYIFTEVGVGYRMREDD